jgi:hypothetical protein
VRLDRAFFDQKVAALMPPRMPRGHPANRERAGIGAMLYAIALRREKALELIAGAPATRRGKGSSPRRRRRGTAGRINAAPARGRR